MSNDDWNKFFQLETEEDINLFSERYQKGELSFESLQHEISFLYNLGLYYTDIYKVNSDINRFFRKDDKYYYPIFFYLKGVQLYESNKSHLDRDEEFVFEIIRRLYVNLAIEYSNQFRNIDALKYFKRALSVDNCFDMAIGNFAMGIEHHTPLLGLEEGKYCLVFNLIYELYMDLNINKLEDGHEFFCKKKMQYRTCQESYINAILKGEDANYNPYDIFTDLEDVKTYEDWCVENTLYLNYINDLGEFQESKFDINLGMINTELELSSSQLYTIKNWIKLYTVQRKNLFQCKDIKNEEQIHELTQVFQCFYSYFDKVAFFIYKYFGLTENERQVNINSIWRMADRDRNNLLDYINQYLYNIYWLRKEYRESRNDKLRINELLSPDAQDFSNIRNILEHKDYAFELIEGLPYINPVELCKKTLRIANIARNLILSVIQMIRVERKLIDPISETRNLNLVYFEYEGFK